ncbi:type II toxin-antitoxin system ParD family antitoxin [Caldimonas brevitalea]|nr:type II toxin-antitoxin system ParD family antitoxin [Caldimonas brevitalea]
MPSTISIAIPEATVEYVDARVASGEYGNRSEYIQDLVRRDQREQAKKRLRALVEEGLRSGPAEPMTDADRNELMAIARTPAP